MYSAFNLKLVAEDRRFFGKKAITNFQSTFDAEKKELIRKAELHIEQNGVLDAQILRDGFFRIKPFDVFISYSHRDKELTLGLAG